MDQRHAFRLDIERFERARSVFALKQKAFPVDTIASLARDVINRLAEDKGITANATEDTGRSLILPQMVDAFCDVILGHDPAAPIRFVEDVLAPGVARREDIYRYIACASRELGSRWDAEKVSYLQVTVAASKLYALVRAVRERGKARAHGSHLAKTALFASVPEEQHTLGVTIAAEVFRNADWDIALMVGQSHEALIARAATMQPPVVGLSVSNSNGLDKLARLVVAIRLMLPDTIIAVAAGPDIDRAAMQDLVDPDLVIADAESAQRALSRALGVSKTG